MQKKYNKLVKFRLYRKLMKEDCITDTIPDEDNETIIKKPDEKEEPTDVLKKIDDKDVPGIIDPKMITTYNKLMDKFEPRQLIYDNKEIK